MRRAIALIALMAVASTVNSAEVTRRVLALHKASEGDGPARNGTFALLEQPLESLGLVVDHRDAESALPSDADMAPYRAVITFFKGPVMRDARGYLAWLDRQIAAGRKVVIVGDIGALQDRASGAFLTHAELSKALKPLGIRYDGFGTNDRARISLIRAAPQMNFEEPFSAQSADRYEKIVPVAAGTTSYLTLTRADIPDGESHPVIATPAGGYVLREAMLYEYQQAGLVKQRWHLDPYAYLTAALDLADRPRLEAATLNGRRLWMAQIDGDGFLTPAESGLSCGQVIEERILKAYDLPVSVSVVSSDLERDPRAAGVAKSIFALTNVEPASHSASHPMDWTAPGLDLAKEIDGSFKALASLTPQGTIRLLTWSGLSNPTAEALRRLSDLGAENINGVNAETGFPNRFDRLFPSRTHLAPMTRRVGDELQISHRASNDYDLTNGWSPDNRSGYENIIETFDRTARTPEIPAHVYFHFYSGQTLASLRALSDVFDWAKRHEVAPVFVSDYARLARDFRTATIATEADGRFVVTNAGACRTIVFPDAAARVDFSRSENVAGYAARHDRLYVFLDGADRHVIALSRDAAPAGLVSAAGWVDRFETNGGTVTLETRAVGSTEMSLRAPKGTFRIRAVSADDTNGNRPFETTASSNDGIVTFTFPATGKDRITVAPASAARGAAARAGLPIFAISLAALPVFFLVRTRRRMPS